MALTIQYATELTYTCGCGQEFHASSVDVISEVMRVHKKFHAARAENDIIINVHLGDDVETVAARLSAAVYDAQHPKYAGQARA